MVLTACIKELQYEIFQYFTLWYLLGNAVSECYVLKEHKRIVLFSILLGTLIVQKKIKKDQNIYSRSKLIIKCSMLRDGMITVYYSNQKNSNRHALLKFVVLINCTPSHT